MRTMRVKEPMRWIAATGVTVTVLLALPTDVQAQEDADSYSLRREVNVALASNLTSATWRVASIFRSSR